MWIMSHPLDAHIATDVQWKGSVQPVAGLSFRILKRERPRQSTTIYAQQKLISAFARPLASSNDRSAVHPARRTQTT